MHSERARPLDALKHPAALDMVQTRLDQFGDQGGAGLGQLDRANAGLKPAQLIAHIVPAALDREGFKHGRQHAVGHPVVSLAGQRLENDQPRFGIVVVCKSLKHHFAFLDRSSR